MLIRSNLSEAFAKISGRFCLFHWFFPVIWPCGGSVHRLCSAVSGGLPILGWIRSGLIAQDAGSDFVQVVR